MKRRHFFSTLAAGALLPYQGYTRAQNKTRASTLKITDAEIWRFEGQRHIPEGKRWQSNCQPIHIYKEFRPPPFEKQQPSKGGSIEYSASYLFLKTNSELQGMYGPIDNEAAVVVDRQLKPFIRGKDALAQEILWDQMFRINRHSRAGHFMMGISAIDNALWDLRGKYYNVPVYRLLGGPARQEVPVYVSTLGYSVEPNAAAQQALKFKQHGFTRQKWFPFYGPGHGAAGLQKNIALVRELRKALGNESDIMFDAFMGWDLNYAMQWVKEVEQYRPRWIEEAFHPSKLQSFIELSRETSIPVASGEHFYNRWEVKRFLESDAIQVVQTDPEWCGGVSELVKICTLGSAYDAHVIPHGHNIHAALHVVASQSPMTCPMVEFLIDKMSYYYMFEKEPPTPVNGTLPLTQKPGFGIDFDESKIQDKVRLSWD